MIYVLESNGMVQAIFLKPDRTKIEEYIQRQRKNERLITMKFRDEEEPEDGEIVGRWTLNHEQWWLTAMQPIT